MITLIAPINNSRQRNVHLEEGGVIEPVLFKGPDDYIYINTISEVRANGIAKLLGISDSEITNIEGKSRMYGGLSGFLLKTKYKSFTAVKEKLKGVFDTPQDVLRILGYGSNEAN